MEMVGAQKNTNGGGIYSLNIKSAASTVGSAALHQNTNSLQIENQDEMAKMHSTGVVGKQSYVHYPNTTTTVQRSMNFRRRPSKEMRVNSAKWNSGKT